MLFLIRLLVQLQRSEIPPDLWAEACLNYMSSGRFSKDSEVDYSEERLTFSVSRTLCLSLGLKQWTEIYLHDGRWNEHAPVELSARRKILLAQSGRLAHVNMNKTGSVHDECLTEEVDSLSRSTLAAYDGAF
jgi:hypothetical protein